MCQKLTSCGNQHRPWHIFVHILQSFPATGRASCCFFAVDLYTEFSTTRLRRVGWGCSIATSQQNCDNQDRTMTSVKIVHFKSEDWFGEMVLPKRGFKWFQGISSQSIPSRPEAIHFRVTAWLDNFSSVRGMLPLKATANTSWAGAQLRLRFWLTSTYRFLSHLYLQGWGGVGRGSADDAQVSSKTDLRIHKTKGWGGVGWCWWRTGQQQDRLEDT